VTLEQYLKSSESARSPFNNCSLSKLFTN